MANNSKKALNIAKKFDIEKPLSASPYGQGMINDTYLIKTGKNKYILQKINKIFKPIVLEDIETVTRHLKEKGFVTPILVRTKNGELGLVENGECWRALTYIPGKTYEKKVSIAKIKSAGALVGKFHKAISDLKYEFKHVRPIFHNTPLIMKDLGKVLEKNIGGEKYKTLNPLAQKVLLYYEKINKKIDSLLSRNIHGDLKINNIRFNLKGEAVSLLDLDTLGKHKIIVELGDAARSWCNPSGEDDLKNAYFDIKIFQKMMEGYFSEAKFLEKDEIAAIPEGIETIMLELAARFITDAFNESYFKLNKTLYPSLYAQNKNKAAVQLKSYEDFVDKKAAAAKILRRLAKY